VNIVGRSALVLEGGAMRCVFSAGVLDAFMQRDFNPFDLAIGVSAGAGNLASHLAAQRGRNRRCYLGLMTRPEFIAKRRLLGARSVIDLDWLWDAFANHEPLDVAALVRNATEFVIVATSATTGTPVYLRPGHADMLDALKGSCAVPFLYRHRVHVGGERLVDGGVSDPLPVEEAYRRGARRILVVRSRPADFRADGRWPARLLSVLLKSDPVLAGALRRMPDRYEAGCRFLERPPSDCRIVQVAPRHPLRSRRTTRNARTLEHDYATGVRAGHEGVERWASGRDPG
jgi:predicted patatin/cPLA2 family phospholipase